MSRSNGQPQIKVEVKSNPLLLAGVREMVAQVARRLCFGDEAAGQMALAVDEALCNVIRHGYGKQPDRPIWLSIWAEGGAWDEMGGACDCCSGAGSPEQIRIVIEDEARQVDPATIRSRNLEEVRPGGLGVHIIQSVMDEARYERRDGVGMRLVMVKKRPKSCVPQTPPARVVAGASPT